MTWAIRFCKGRLYAANDSAIRTVKGLSNIIETSKIKLIVEKTQSRRIQMKGCVKHRERQLKKIVMEEGPKNEHRSSR